MLLQHDMEALLCIFMSLANVRTANATRGASPGCLCKCQLGSHTYFPLPSCYLSVTQACCLTCYAACTCQTPSNHSVYFTGKYSEHAFQALDYILDEASKYGVRLLLTLVNNWDNADSKTQVNFHCTCDLVS